jgi:leucyl-tRNA---protein transferase
METLFTFVSPPGPCEYLPNQTWQIQYETVGGITPGEYMERLRHGWRRFGHSMFRPACASCRMCQSLRVPVATFRPSRSQTRALTANLGTVRIDVGTPRVSQAKADLYAKFHRYQHDAKGWPAPERSADALMSFVDNPFPTEEWCYYVEERLIAVGYVDRLPEGLSAIYYFYDPAERHRSLGTFNVLSILAAARERQLPHVYLGYYVEGCGSLEYKGRFRPNEVLTPRGTWEAFLG